MYNHPHVSRVLRRPPDPRYLYRVTHFGRLHRCAANSGAMYNYPLVGGLQRRVTPEFGTGRRRFSSRYHGGQRNSQSDSRVNQRHDPKHGAWRRRVARRRQPEL
jgi:hypothetical protein